MEDLELLIGIGPKMRIVSQVRKQAGTSTTKARTTTALLVV